MIQMTAQHSCCCIKKTKYQLDLLVETFKFKWETYDSIYTNFIREGWVFFVQNNNYFITMQNVMFSIMRFRNFLLALQALLTNSKFTLTSHLKNNNGSLKISEIDNYTMYFLL